MLTIIGGSGFIGTRLCKRLEQSGVSFEILDKVVSKSFPEKTVLGDVRDIESLRKGIHGDTIINLAAEHKDNVRPISLYDEVNVAGARNICVVASEKNIKNIIFTSSVAVYGFAEPNTDESGEIHYFNDYGRTKWLAENEFRAWQEEELTTRSLVIIRPTVVFGEQNRGNVYNLLKQIASGRFVMIGRGTNKKSMAYVENVAAFIQYSLSFGAGIHLFNYIDKPDMDMNSLVHTVYSILNKKNFHVRVPYALGLLGGYLFDFLSFVTKKSFPISSIRIKKFCATTQFDTSIPRKTDFVPPVSLQNALVKTIEAEFIKPQDSEHIFYSE